MYTDDTKTFFFLDYHKSLALMQSFDNITSILDTEEKKKSILKMCCRYDWPWNPFKCLLVFITNGQLIMFQVKSEQGYFSGKFLSYRLPTKVSL